VGSYAITSATLSTPVGSAAGNYLSAATFTGAPTLAITVAPLSASIGDQTKIYGADDPLLASITPTLAGLINRTVSTWNGAVTVNDTGLASATLASLTRISGENVGSYDITTATFNVLTGASAGNYSAPAFIGTPTLSVTAATLTATIADQSKVYGNADPSASSIAVTLTPINRTVSTWNGDVLVNDTGLVDASIAGLSRVAGENVGSYDYTGATLSTISGPAAGNYTAAATLAGLATLDITPRDLSVINLTANNKVYDATTLATLTGGTLSGLVNGDAVTLHMGSASFANKNVGADLPVTTSGFALIGNADGDYVLVNPTGLTASITPAPLDVTALANTKVYNGQVGALAIPVISGLKGNDTALASETYVTASVGTGKTLTPSVTISDGNGGANYAVTLTANDNGIILALIPSGPTATVASPNGYIPTAGNNSLDGNAGGVIPALQAISSVPPGQPVLVFDDSASAALGAETVVGALKVMFSMDSSGVQHTLLGGGESYVVTDSDGSSSSTTVMDVYEHTVRFSVPNTSLALHMDVPVADGSKIFGLATVDAADGQITVSLNREGGTLPERSATSGAGSRSIDVQMAGSDGSTIEFGVSLADDLIIEPRNANALAVLLSRRDETLLQLVLGEAIVKAVTQWNVTSIPSVRLLNP
jgi:hypothetical protein